MATINDYREVHVNQNATITILASQTQSELYDCAGTTLCAIRADSSLSETTLNLLVTNDPSVEPAYLYDTANALKVALRVPTLSPGEAAWIQIPPALLAGLRFFSVVSDVPPVSDSRLYCAVRPV